MDKVGFTIEDVRTIRRVTNDLDLPLDVLYGGDVYSLPSAHESLYLTCNPLLNKIVASDEEMPEDFVYNKAVSAVDAKISRWTNSKIPAELHERFEIFKSRDILLEWSPKGVHKANGLAKLIGHLGIDQSEVMACGDEGNDLSMIEWAGLGVAMANATDEIKSVPTLSCQKQ